MTKVFRNLTILSSLFLMIFLIYEFKFNADPQAWKNYPKPQMASFMTLDEEQMILKELDHQTHYKSYKVLDPLFFSKKSFFNPIHH